MLHDGHVELFINFSNQHFLSLLVIIVKKYHNVKLAQEPH